MFQASAFTRTLNAFQPVIPLNGARKDPVGFRQQDRTTVRNLPPHAPFCLFRYIDHTFKLPPPHLSPSHTNTHTPFLSQHYQLSPTFPHSDTDTELNTSKQVFNIEQYHRCRKTTLVHTSSCHAHHRRTQPVCARVWLDVKDFTVYSLYSPEATSYIVALEPYDLNGSFYSQRTMKQKTDDVQTIRTKHALYNS